MIELLWVHEPGRRRMSYSLDHALPGRDGPAGEKVLALLARILVQVSVEAVDRIPLVDLMGYCARTSESTY
jgi:hypothetical protein